MLHPRIKVEGVELKVEKDLFGYDNVEILFVAKGIHGRRYLVYCSDIDNLDYSIASTGNRPLIDILSNSTSVAFAMGRARYKYRVTMCGVCAPREAKPAEHPGRTPGFTPDELPELNGEYGKLDEDTAKYLESLIASYKRHMTMHEYRPLSSRFAFDEDELLRTIRVDTLPVTIEKVPCSPYNIQGARCKIMARGNLVAEYFRHDATGHCYPIELRRLEVCNTGVTSRQILAFDWDDLEAMTVTGKASNLSLAKLEKRLQEGIHAFNLTVAASVAAATFCAMYATGLKHPPKPRPIDLRAWHVIRGAASGNFGMAVINLWKITASAQQSKPIYRVYWNDRITKNDSMQFTDRQEAFQKAWDMRREDTVNDVSVDMITEIAEPIRESEWNPMYDILSKQ